MDSLTGFQDLTFVIPPSRRIPVNCPISPQDQQKIRLAISLRRVDPADVPVSAKSVQSARLVTAAEHRARSNENIKKRKAEEGTSLEEEPAEEVVEEEVKDELYCTVRTNVVGIQYYKGWVNAIPSCLLTSLFKSRSRGARRRSSSSQRAA